LDVDIRVSHMDHMNVNSAGLFTRPGDLAVDWMGGIAAAPQKHLS
jgi:hypothetical protein